MNQQPAPPHFFQLGGTLANDHRLHAAAAAANPARTRRKAFVVAHDQLRFNLVDGIHRHADHDQQRRAAEVEVDPQTVQQPAREILIDPVADQRQTLQLDARKS